MVPTDRLVDEVAPGDGEGGGPDRGSAVKVQVSRLRKALGGTVTITGSNAGYRLDLPADRIDAVRFERHVEAARGHRGARPRQVAAEAAAALALWRGRPLGGIGDADAAGPLAAQAARLEELRLEALELRLEADLALGGGTGLVAELEALVAEHPYRERLWRHLMLALYRADRQADALAAYHRARRALDEQLGIEPSAELVELEAAILRQEVPNLRPPERRHNLPAAITSFVGRAAELAEVRAIIARQRLVTLTGVGGVGKTRLGLEVARGELGVATDGAWFVDLARLADGQLVAAEVATAIGVAEDAATSPIDRLVDHLRDRDALIVLDNCEHLVAACAALAERVLGRCPGVRVLATSRVPLGIAGETTYPVPPLSLEGAGASGPGVARSDAVSLFVERALTASPGLAIDADAAAVVGRICRELEGLPLAIELAAARARSLALPDIADRLRDRFRFLVSWRRVAEARHQTLRQAIDWSYDLLAPEDRRLLERLSIFAGGFDLPAATAVAQPATEMETLDTLERLMDASLVVPTPTAGGHTRYRLLETVRQHAAERLADAGEDAANRERHARYYVALTMSADLSHREGEGERLTLEWLATDRDNIRAALAWLEEHDEWAELVLVGEALWRYWWVRGEAAEGRGWLERAVALRDAHAAEASSEQDLRDLGDLLRGLAGLAWSQGDFDAAGATARRARGIFEELGDDVGQARTLNTIGVIEHGRRDMPAARAAFERSIALLRDADIEPVRRAQLLATSMDNLGSALYEAGETERAIELYRAARTLHATEGQGSETALMDLHLGRAAVTAGRLEEAATLLASALGHYRGLGFLQYVTECIEGIGWLATVRGDFRTAATAMGAASRLREQTRTPFWGRMEEQLVTYAALAREGLGETEFDAAWEAGRADPTAAVEVAFAWLTLVTAA